MKLKTDAKFWDVRFSRPVLRKYTVQGETKEYLQNSNFHVMAAADSVAKVQELIAAEYPDATIWQVNHRGGDCAIIVQPDLMT